LLDEAVALVKGNSSLFTTEVGEISTRPSSKFVKLWSKGQIMRQQFDIPMIKIGGISDTAVAANAELHSETEIPPPPPLMKQHSLRLEYANSESNHKNDFGHMQSETDATIGDKIDKFTIAAIRRSRMLLRTNIASERQKDNEYCSVDKQKDIINFIKVPW
jgi:hypothetical protein